MAQSAHTTSFGMEWNDIGRLAMTPPPPDFYSWIYLEIRAGFVDFFSLLYGIVADDFRSFLVWSFFLSYPFDTTVIFLDIC